MESAVQQFNRIKPFHTAIAFKYHLKKTFTAQRYLTQRVRFQCVYVYAIYTRVLQWYGNITLCNRSRHYALCIVFCTYSYISYILCANYHETARTYAEQRL